MVDLTQSLILDTKSLSIEGDASSWGGQEPVYVHLRTNQLPGDRLPPSTLFAWDQDYSRLEVSRGFRQLVERFDTSDPLRDPAKTLYSNFRGYHRYACQNRVCPLMKIYLPVIDCGRYHPHKSFKHVSRCVGRILDQIEFLEKKSPVDYLICLDLTCPGEISDRVMDPGVIKRLRRSVNLFIENLRILLSRGKRRFSKLGGFYSIHIWATKDPVNPHLHVHLQLFNVAFSLKENRFYRFKPMISHLLVKKAWRDALRSQGLWGDPIDRDLPDCYIHYLKLKDRERLIHRLRYVFRKPIVDLNMRLQGDLPDLDLDPRWIRHLLDYTPRRVKIGFMSNLKHLGYLCPKSFSERCPFCGGVLQKIGFVPGNLPDLPHFIRDRSGRWIQVDPPGGGDAVD